MTEYKKHDSDNNHADHGSSPAMNLQGTQPESGESRTTPAMIEKFVIRLPKGLRNKIKHLSEQNRRSMNSEIIMVLEKHIQQNLADAASEFASGAVHEAQGEARLSDDELTRRLENLPEEKKQALLELLG